MNNKALPKNFGNLTSDEEKKLEDAQIVAAGVLLAAYRQIMNANGIYEIREKATEKLVAYKNPGGPLMLAEEAEPPRSYGGGRQPFTKRYCW